MKMAIRLGQKGTGFTEPNPLVGAVVVKNHKVISTGYHRIFGGEHAERAALLNLSARQAAAATLYVPLEPCSHHGKQPPCDELIIKMGVSRVVISTQDPCSLVNGRGIKKLRKNRVRVDLGCLRDIYKRVNRHYFKYITTGRPYVMLRAGMSIDGKMTDQYRKSRWVTDERLREYSHDLRGEFSAILVGGRTVVEDDPLLTIRDTAWKGKRLYRVVLDSQNQLPPDRKIFKDQDDFPLIIFSSKKAANRKKRVEKHFFVDADDSGLDLEQVLAVLGQDGIASLLVEGGGEVIDSFLRRQLFDEVVFFTAPKLIGGRNSVQPFASGMKLSDAVVLENREILPLDHGYIVRGSRTNISDASESG